MDICSDAKIFPIKYCCIITGDWLHSFINFSINYFDLITRKCSAHTRNCTFEWIACLVFLNGNHFHWDTISL